VFNFALVSTDGEALGSLVFSRPDVRPGDLIPRRRGSSLRVVQIIEPERRDQLTVLVVASS
jgi:hypothetical protein